MFIVDLEKSITIFYNETPLGTVKIQSCFEKPTAFIFKVLYTRIQATGLAETLLNFYQTIWHHISAMKISNLSECDRRNPFFLDI
jgi:hypothetical protein